MSRYTIVLLGLLAVMVTVYAEGNSRCHRDNESWHICGEICEPICTDPEPNPKWCPAIPCNKYTANCRCNDGYVRDTDKSCVPRKDCQMKQQEQPPLDSEE